MTINEKNSDNKQKTVGLLVIALTLIGIIYIGYYSLLNFVFISFEQNHQFFWTYFSNLLTAIFSVIIGFSISHYFFHASKPRAQHKTYVQKCAHCDICISRVSGMTDSHVSETPEEKPDTEAPA